MNNILKPNETMEDLIRTLENAFDTVSGIMPVAYWYENLNEDGRIRDIHFSEQMRAMLGYASLREFPDELDSFIDHVHPNDVMGVLDNAIAAGTGKIDRYDARYRIRKADGTYLWCNATGQVVKDHAGKTVGMYGAFIDISAEVGLREKTKEESEKLIEGLLKDYNLVYRVNLSDASFRMLKIDRGIIGEGMKFDDFIQARKFFIEEVAYEPDRELLRREMEFDSIRARLKTEPSYRMEYRAVVGGVAIWHEMEISALNGDEVAIGFVMKDAQILNRHIRRKLLENYDAVYVVNLNTDQMKVLKASGIMMNKPTVVVYSKMVREFASGLNEEAGAYFEKTADIAYEKRALMEDGKTEYVYQSPYYEEGPVWVKCETHVLTWANDEPETAVIGISRVDALQREKIELNGKLEDALREVTEERNRFSVAADLINSANWSFALDENDEITDAEFFGEPAKILGIDLKITPHAWEEILHPDDREKTLTAFNAAIRDHSGKTPYDVIYRMMDRNGNYNWFRSAGKIIEQRDGSREFFGIHINVNDRIEEELKRQHQLEEALTFTNFFLDTYVSAYYVDLNDLSCQVYKRTAELENAYPILTNYFDSISEYINRDVHPDDRAQLLAIVRPEAMRAKLKEKPEFTHVFRDITGGAEKTYRMQVIRGAEKGHVAFGFIDISEEIGEQNRRLREAEESRRLIESVASAYNVAYQVNMTDDSFRLLRMNSAFVERSGMAGAKTFSEIRASFTETILHPGERARMSRELDYAAIRKNLEERQSYDVEYRVLFNGATAWHMLNITKIDEDEFAIGFAERDLEITKRRLEEKRFDEYFSLLVVDMDTETVRVLKNENWYSPMPLGAPEPYGPAIREFAACLPEEPKAFFLQISNLNFVRRELAVDDKRTYSYKSEHLEADKWVDVTTYVILRHEDGTPAMFTLGFGIVDALATAREELRQRLETALAEAQAANRTVTEQNARLEEQLVLTDGLSRDYHTVWLLEGSGKHNMHLYRSTGVKTIKSAVQLGLDENCYDTGIVKYVNEYVYEDDRARVLEQTKFETVERETPEVGTYVVSYRRYNKDHTGYDYHQMCYAKAVSDSGAVNYIFAYRDADQMLREQIAQQELLEKALEEAQAASRAKSDFLFNMSHDVRTPMNAILGFTNMAEKHLDDREKVADCLEKTKQSGNLLLALINGVLDMSRIESGSAEVDEQPGDVTLSFANIESTLCEEAAAKDVDLSFEIGEITDRYVYADFTRCLRVFTNLITNGIKYSRAGGWVKVRCEQAAPRKDGRALFRYTVEDNGIGMSEEFQQHMFEAFTREYSSTLSGIQGTGLGLSVCKTFVEYLGGTIDCESALGKGTKFTVLLPFRVQEGRDYTDPKSGIRVSAETGATAAAQLNFRGKKVLLVEDNELNREIALDILEEEGLVVEEAEDGSVAVGLLREKGPAYYDFILMDIQMPVMNGYEATKAIRAMYPGAAIPIIAVSANAFEEDKRASKEAGMNDHVAKPINVKELFGVLESYL